MLKEDEIVPGTKVKWKGAFDFDLLYNKIKDWLVVEGFGEPKESHYAERIKPDGKQVEIVWDADGKEEEDYFKGKLHLVFRGTRINDVEVNKDGRKMKLQQGTIDITISSALVHDYGDKFKDKKKWGEFYEKYFMGDNVDVNQVELYDKTLDLIDMIKDFLAMYAF